MWLRILFFFPYARNDLLFLSLNVDAKLLSVLNFVHGILPNHSSHSVFRSNQQPSEQCVVLKIEVIFFVFFHKLVDFIPLIWLLFFSIEIYAFGPVCIMCVGSFRFSSMCILTLDKFAQINSLVFVGSLHIWIAHIYFDLLLFSFSNCTHVSHSTAEHK